jgi:predicted nucleic acid-binding protein
MIGAHDLIIAATAISLDYEVVTSTMRDFTKVDGLRVRKG